MFEWGGGGLVGFFFQPIQYDSYVKEIKWEKEIIK